MNKSNTILIVDDTEMNRAMLADMLSEDYEILEASNGSEAVSILCQKYDDISLILLDIVMPEMDGFEVMEIMNKKGWIERIPIITISAETSSTYIDHAYDLGASDYINRPFDQKTVQRRVKNTIMLYSKQKRLEGMVADQIVEKEKNNFLMVEILSDIVEFRNGESGLHVLHIRTLTEIFLRKLQEISDQYHFTPAQVVLIVNASALHDIGKISIPEEILNKPGRLTQEEFEIMKTHSAIGAQIMEDALERHHEDLIQIAYNICRWHHERYDGRGYPDGLMGDDIPMEAQIVALADVYDALTSERVYKSAFSHDKAVQMILNGECGTFNPILLECLKQVAPHLEEELKIHSVNGLSETNIQELSNQVISSGTVSNRTLALLEEERVKYQFFASMSKEIQFEYDVHRDILTMSEWGAKQLGLKVFIEHPMENEDLHKIFSKKDYLDISDRLRRATPSDPFVNNNYKLCVKGEERWYKAYARPIWSGDENGQYSSAIGKFIDIHEEQMQLNKLKEMACQDSLTHLNNHSSARKIIERALTQEDKQFAMVLIDLDHFKDANDLYGHMFGDQVLVHLADIVSGSVRSDDITARIGGDEFLLFMEYNDDIEPTVERVFQTLHSKYNEFPITVSMGVAIFPKDGTDYDTLFQCADKALYAAKKNSRNMYCFYNDSMEDLLSVLSPMDH